MSAENLPFEFAGMVARGLFGTYLTEPTDDYRPQRFADLSPDIVFHIDTHLGNMPVYVFNADAYGTNTNHADIYHHQSLMVRADQGFVTPTLDSLSEIAEEQDRALIAIGAPGSGGRLVSPLKVAKTSLLGMAKATHQVIDVVEERMETDVGAQVHTGASLGGYLSLAMASEMSFAKRDELLLPERDVSMIIPIAPAGWKLRPHQVFNTLRQFTQHEVAHVFDKASYMDTDERLEYLQSLMLTVPLPTAVPTYLKLTADFLASGNLEQVIAGIPNDVVIRGVAFDGDYVTLPHVLYKHIQESGRFTDATIEVKVGRHMSLDSFRKVMASVVRPALEELYLIEIS